MIKIKQFLEDDPSGLSMRLGFKINCGNTIDLKSLAEGDMLKTFFKYTILSILRMVGISAFVFADTYFVSKAFGAIGLAALNISIPIVNIVNGVALMISIGGGSAFSILRAQQDIEGANKIFSLTVNTALVIGIVFMSIGILFSENLAKIFGADTDTLAMSLTYIRTILLCAPVNMINSILISFSRNDHKPALAMVGVMAGGLTNILFDYLLMFPLQMGMFGAAIATGLSPLVGIAIILLNRFKDTSNYRYIKTAEVKPLGRIIKLGTPSFITELSGAFVLILFNLIILSISGNIGVASYGIIANISFIVIAIFTGLGQGLQPIASAAYGVKDMFRLQQYLKFGIIAALFISAIMYAVLFMFTKDVVTIFNAEKLIELEQIASRGIRIYFLGFFFAGMNIVVLLYQAAIERVHSSFLISTLRGFVVIFFVVLLTSKLWQLDGVWISFVITEGIVFITSLIILQVEKRNIERA
ncbi:MATE family efflux transporter [Treponema phagedenis]|uniref:MATE family efflux transporter n=1 Tax=Treponema phagedenis TaxID=162 RepID=A0AAE6M7P6_TREPH|nr:MATE family efflux transporter [Treponema phagedenis]QEJ94518.1 MATE family efflux transporter [Treponema phagedenis]QEJ98773.1 MATE family efflux transporter [Treponema phagedenis]QEK01600.1 MATE family efflux transporter [Treponema phagedenis]QEK04278.1 MATE family efflux transporter [Treponema phagedenis]QEK06686.1 MATE family efflux transporter [Treponema phagedenis]